MKQWTQWFVMGAIVAVMSGCCCGEDDSTVNTITPLPTTNTSFNETPSGSTNTSETTNSYNQISDTMEMAQIKSTTTFDLYEYRSSIAQSAVPFDNANSYPFGPNDWRSTYSHTREYFGVTHDQTLGVIWRDQASSNIFYSTYNATMDNNTQIKLPNLNSEGLAAATYDKSGNLYYITIQTGNGGAADISRTATLYKVNSNGTLIASKTLDTSVNGLNIVNFHDWGWVATLKHHGNRLALALSRTMHKSYDGLNHQGAISVVFDDNTLSTLKHHGQTSSHSMEHIIEVDNDGKFIEIDLGDGYPRGVHFHRFDDMNIEHKVLYTFKVQHGTSPTNPAGKTFDFYSEISQTTNYYRWSNDNQVYTEIGGLIETSSGDYMAIFIGEPDSNGYSLDNSRAGAVLTDSHDIGFVKVSKDLSTILSSGISETSGYYSFDGYWITQVNEGISWLVDYKDVNQENANKLKTLKLPNGNILLVWEKWTKDSYVSTYMMVIDENGNVIQSPTELYKGLRLSRRDDMIEMNGDVYIFNGDNIDKKLEVFIIKLK